MAETYHLPDRLYRLRHIALIAGIIGLLLGGMGVLVNPKQFFNSYLYAHFFWLGIALGGLAITMLHHLTGGDWGLAIRRECEAAALTLPLLALLFAPLFFGLHHLFPWADETIVATDKILQHQSVYFNPNGFILRAVICFVAWTVLAWMLCSESMQYERTVDYRIVRKMRRVSAAGLLIHFVTVSIASWDWVMSREMHFYSSILGIMIAVGQALSAMVFVIALLRTLDEESEMHEFLTENRLNDLGNLILTLVILWAYMSFAQFLIIWMGNISHETPWYVHRGLAASNPNGWKYVALILLVLHFFVPFLILLWREAKRKLYVLTSIALCLLVLRAVDVMWLIAPSFSDHPKRTHLSWMDVPLIVGIGGIWFFMFVAMLRRRPLLAREELDPEEAEEAERAGHPGTRHGGAGAHA
jgi:hypothetical protein